MNKPHLKLSAVHRHYGEGERLVRVLDAADLTVESGELVALVAPSGAGKSTLLHLCGLLESPQEGEVEIIGEKTSQMGDRARTQLRRTTVGYVYQFHHLLPEFTALENVTLPQLIAGVDQKAAETRAMELLSLLNVGHRASHRPAELSGGEQQRVAIARAAANRPRVILADEPTGNLDPETSDLVFEALKSLIRNEGAAALIATHNYDLARRADRIVTIRNGLVVPHTV
ncbi:MULTISPECIES: ABC transporter ATP-binding protein [unclassified Devosia]|uniref:ABC transporter ATP-binding protein n=1 Tax=unclassified Devosia TaxID=196773 RepID=UPI00145FC83B|nr:MULTISPECIES: ABC transporter ATP-binding protein [unclassified Devosia]MBJ6986349.1 ABC transporter ATP-binding protein [Devosia sp. MC521]MBK1793137.1 ABC transporter ATP-binding protein [Devosia sp. WQ 349K1]QMW64172.1 ABC transporter ATP-binding protein [Devosia sp. MC521]